ncbi:YitT family protein [Ectobacillus sp. JY-23]|uniref:YitT family protein n=1 Tax=Ectobacillus sp. JY-23 TaxID=2933872 RepID=UPI001FF69691|nr:YitT family protein [Ectobacillus sp. JY-23]UOY92125.1 YitT family protein [Ectobacillus sp. JY-23]
MELKLPYTELVKKLFIVMLGGVLNAVAMNLFLIPANVYASGFAGLAQLLSRVLGDFTPISISTGILYIAFNIPVVILAWLKVGRSFTIFSFISIAFTTLFLEIIPIKTVSTDIILNAVFGGVIAAIGIGLTLKWGASTGGLDIIAMILSRIKDKPLGTYFFTFNAFIILTAGYLYGWEKALYTLVSLYASTRLIDAIHTRHVKLTTFIVTKHGPELRKAIHAHLVRGITSLPATGAFTNENKEMLMIVITRYELYDLQRIIHEVDPKAFTNVVHTETVLGLFRKE